MTQKPDDPTRSSRDMPTASDAEALHIAASRGDAAQVVRLLESGADVEARDARGRTPLLVAAREGRADAARLLLEAGAAVDARGESMSITPLMASAQRGDVALVRLLLEAAADPNAAARNGAGVLARAVIGGNLVVAKALLDAGADPDGAGSSAPPNTSPLWVAVAMKKRDLVNLLLERGANTNTGDSVSDTPFGVAVSGGDATIARMLLEAGADPLRPALSNLPLLAVAIRFTNLPMAELLEEYGLSLAKSDTPNVVTTAERMMLAEAEDRKNKPFAG